METRGRVPALSHFYVKERNIRQGSPVPSTEPCDCTLPSHTKDVPFPHF